MKEYLKFYSFFWKFGKNYKINLLILFVLIVFFTYGLTIFVSPFILKYFIDNMSKLSLSKGIFLILIYAFSNANFLIYYFTKGLEYKSISHIVGEITENIFITLTEKSTDYFNKTYNGEILSKVTNIVNNIEVNFNVTMMLIRNFIILIIMSLIFCYYNLFLGLVLIFSIIIYNVIISIFSDKLATKNNIANSSLNKITAFINDIIINILNVKIFSNIIKEKSNLKQNIDIYMENKKNAFRQENFNYFFNFLFCLSLTGFVFSVLIFQLFSGKITIGTFIFLVEIFRYNYENIECCSYLLSSLLSKLKIFSDSINYINSNNEIKNKENAKNLNIQNGKIEFKNIKFRY